jgi:outer membrane immunogenic protein
MRAFVFVSLILVASTEARAADPPGPVADGQPVSAPTWTGWYAGGNAGLGWSRNDGHFPAFPLTVDIAPGVVAPVIPADPRGFASSDHRAGPLAGAQVGYNYQFTPGQGFVLGAEADIQWADFGSHRRSFGSGFLTVVPVPTRIGPVRSGQTGNVALFGNDFRDRDRDDNDWFATARLRAGYAFGPLLVYGTAGLVLTDHIGSGNEAGTNPGFVPDEDGGDDEGPEEAAAPGTAAARRGAARRRPRAVSPTLFRNRRNNGREVGWTVGAGLEYALTDLWTAKLEGLYVNTGRTNWDVGGVVVGVSNRGAPIRYGAPGSTKTTTEDFFVARVGLNYRFGVAPSPFPSLVPADGDGPSSPADRSGKGAEEGEDERDAPAGGAASNEEEGGEEDGGGEDERDAPVGGAASNEEGEDEAEPGWQVKAVLNPALLAWNDGKRGARLVDNVQDGTGFEVERTFKLGGGWEMGLQFGFDTSYASSDAVHQRDWDGDGLFVELADALVELGHEKWGKLAVGHYDSASDNINKMNLAGSDVLADAEVDQWNADFFLRVSGVGLTTGRGNLVGAGVDEDGEGIPVADLRWGDFFRPALGGRTGRFLSYVTPQVGGFEAAASVGQPQDITFVKGQQGFEDRTNGLVTDAALRYRGDWGPFRVLAGVGAWRDTAEEEFAEEPTKDIGFGGSFALFHKATGLNIALNYGREKHSPVCEDPGEVTGRCPGADQFVYVKGGVVREFFDWGPTAIYGEYYHGRGAPHDSDESILRTLELTLEQAEELSGFVAKAWGLGIVQTVKPSRDRNYITDLYVGYRRYALDLNLLGANGPVGTRKINDFDAVMAGVRFRWGERFRPIGEEEE